VPVKPAPDMVFALCRATGLRMYDLPLTPERVWRGLHEKSPG
jgi:CO/xanthine dehydrogenase Mo-binding subunit